MKIGFVGLGLMGSGMAASLQRAGRSLIVTDLHKWKAEPHLASGAEWAETIADLGRLSDVVMTSLPTPRDVEAVAYGTGNDGLVDMLRPGTAWIDMTTNSVAVVRDLQARLGDRNIGFLDAPVSGGPAGAASGRLAVWVGGGESTFTKYRAVLDDMADSVTYVGEAGAGTVAKLVHNTASAAINAVTAEVMTLGVKAGIEPLALWQALRSGAAGRRRSFDAIGPRFLQGKFEPPSFELRLAHKDVGLAMQLARDVGVPMRMCDLLFDELTEAMNKGWQNRDSQSFLLLQQLRSGIPPFEITADDIADELRP